MRNFSFDTYADYGLSENPFRPHALRPDPVGVRLLVGRDSEAEKVARSLHKQGKITCLDGQVGVGKTSLVNVAAYICYEAYLQAKTTQMLLPVHEAFQLKKDDDINAFCASVFRRVAHTLIKYREDLRQLDKLPPNTDRVWAWLNSPIVEHITGAMALTGTAGIPGLASASGNVAGGLTPQLNTSPGFNEHGFEQLVKQWLTQIFSEANGAVVCVIDNLELLESGAQAKRTLEGLRDRLFTVDGLRWVFCGANGVIHSLAASARLASFLNMPVIEVDHVASQALEPLFRARVREFSMVDEQDAWSRLPIRLEDLRSLYLIVNYNLRDLLALADEYCDEIHSRGVHLQTEDQKAKRFAKWLETSTTMRYSALKSRLPADAWVILDLVMADEFRGTFGVGNFDSLNQNSKVAIARSTFEKRLRDLVRFELISKNLDESVSDGSFKRDVFTVTAKGALIHYARLVKHENQGIKPLTWLRRVNMGN